MHIFVTLNTVLRAGGKQGKAHSKNTFPTGRRIEIPVFLQGLHLLAKNRQCPAVCARCRWKSKAINPLYFSDIQCSQCGEA